MELSGHFHSPAAVSSGESAHGTHLMGWLGPRVGVEAVEKGNTWNRIQTVVIPAFAIAHAIDFTLDAAVPRTYCSSNLPDTTLLLYA
jgi:hypothetical protein